MKTFTNADSIPNAGEAFFVPASQGVLADLSDHRGYVKIGSQHTGGALLFSENHSDYGANVSPHIHHREDEIFYILSGRFALRIGEQTIEAGPGDTVFGPRGVPHAWQCVSPEGGRAIFAFTPGSNFEAFAIEMAKMQASPAQNRNDPAAMMAFAELAARYGIEMLPPGK